MKRRSKHRLKRVWMTMLLVGASAAFFYCAWGCIHAVAETARDVLPRIVRFVGKQFRDKPKKAKKRYTLKERLKQYGPGARPKLEKHFKRAGVAYPPERLTLVALKRERRMLVYAEDDKGIHFIKSYPILGASGSLGPKRREGDFQVPEGLYDVNFFNPNSSNHLSMRINYPNRADKAQAKREKRTHLGGEIYIHGKTTSAGCLAMGDRAIEEIWVMAVDVGKRNIDVIVSPVDFRSRKLPPSARKQSAWVLKRYTKIRAALSTLPPPKVVRPKKLKKHASAQ